MWITIEAFLPQLLRGAITTLALAAVSAVAGTLLGLAVALAKLSASRMARLIADAYTTIVRGVPDLLVIFVIFFGGTVTLTSVFGRYVEVNPFMAGTAALAIVFGAYAGEIFRGGIMAVPRGQIDAARALGLAPRAVFMAVTLPQAWRLALPAFGNQSLILLKQTSLVSVVGLEELMRKGVIAVGATNQPFTFYATVGAIYMVLTGVLTLALRGLENRASRGYART